MAGDRSRAHFSVTALRGQSRTWGEVETNDFFSWSAKAKPDGFFGGGQVGWNWQAPGSQWVWGVEVDSHWADINESWNWFGGGAVGKIETKMDYFGTARLRVGYAWDRVMVYGTGGLVWGSNEISANVAAGPFIAGASSSNTHVGWTVGAGLEWALLDNCSAKVE